MEVRGKLVKMLDLETGTSKAGKSWEKQTAVIDTGKDFNSSEIVRWSYGLILHDIFISVILLAEKSRIYE